MAPIFRAFAGIRFGPARARGERVVTSIHEEEEAVLSSHPHTLVITGAYPPDICGVGDYSERLLASAPTSWQLFVERDWSIRAMPGIVRRLLAQRPKNIIIQYPTQGYGWSLVPHLLVVFGWLTRRYRSVIALHEFTSLLHKGRLTLALVSHFACHIVFTTDTERDAARAYRFFSTRVPTSVIGILSNIPWSPELPAFADRTIDIAYFGHIRPNKGLEEFLDVVAGLHQANSMVRSAVIGVIPDGYADFAGMVVAQCERIGCALILNLDDAAVARMLAGIRILYLPFRDGVSARRGSVLAGLGNGAVIATRIGDATPDALVPALVVCTGTLDDVGILLEVLNWSNARAEIQQRAGVGYIDTMLPRDWAQVAELYEQALAR